MKNPLILPKAKKQSTELKKSAGILDDFAVRKDVHSKTIVTDDHNADGEKPEVVNVIYGTADNPTIAASDTPIGTMYAQYIP